MRRAGLSNSNNTCNKQTIQKKFQDKLGNQLGFCKRGEVFRCKPCLSLNICLALLLHVKITLVQKSGENFIRKTWFYVELQLIEFTSK